MSRYVLAFLLALRTLASPSLFNRDVGTRTDTA
jgi:hypothetical protein